MRPELDAEQARLADEVDRVLDSAPPGTAPLDLFALLGAERLLAVHYPVEFGGRGLSLAHHVAAAERMGARGLPDVVHIVTVQALGGALLAFGSAEQQARWLPPIAAGRLFGSLLLSEPEAGSDAAAIRATANPDGEGWRITGVKTWSVATDRSGVALCSARTRAGLNRYDGISLFLLDLADPAIRMTPLPRALGDPYFEVTVDGAYVGPESLVGPLHRGWSLLPSTISFERAGFECLSRAASWLAAAEEEFRRLPSEERAAGAGDLVRLRARLAGARALAFHTMHTADDLDVDEVLIAFSKLACARAGQAVARWAGEELPPTPALRAAVAEAPELTVSGGPQEQQLDLIAHDFPIGGAVR
ncbi:acyl-CoA dehydrogenase family protein [Streptomyces sp. G45]|uniref:acyl-CoA dehydrogenase family protein n=1 Tax=Streptomyces sp. G45 TaxID=3406627 RepID=UPI003C140892